MQDIEVLDPLPRHGGRRAGAGRKPGYSPKAARDAMAGDGPGATGDGGTDNYVDYSKARARNEAAKADLAELEFKIRSKQYVARDAVRQASATAYAMAAQAMRSIPDNLERRLGATPAVCAAVGDAIDATLAELSKSLEMLSGPED